LILEAFLYNVFIIQARVNIDWVEYYQDSFNEYSLLLMYTLLTLFGDTGLIFCLDSNISIDNILHAQQVAGIVFTSIGILVVVLNIGLLCKK
jgi:energy-converting hydrogenase Eha subunit H